MKRTFLYLSLGTALLAGSLQAEVQPLQNGSKVQFSETPGAVQTAVKNQSGGATIEDVDRGTLNGRTVYEVAFKKEGKHNELRVAEDGTVLDRIVEGQSVGAGNVASQAPAASGPYVHLQNGQKVQMSEVPQNVQNTIKAQAGGATIEDIDRGTFQGRTVYEAAFKQNGKHNELRVAEDGSIVARYTEGVNLDLATVQQNQTGGQSQPAEAIETASREDNAWFSEPLRNARKVPWASLPQHVRQAVRDRSGATARIDEVQQGQTRHGKTYQVGFNRGNREVEMRVSDDASRVREVVDGRPVFWVAPRELSQVPPKVQDIVRDRIGSSNIERIQYGAQNNKPFYRFNYSKNGQPTELRVGPDGSEVREMAVSRTWVDEPAGTQRP